jgi:hypothetical protein
VRPSIRATAWSPGSGGLSAPSRAGARGQGQATDQSAQDDAYLPDPGPICLIRAIACAPRVCVRPSLTPSLAI